MKIKLKDQPSSQRLSHRVHWFHKIIVLLVYLTIALTSLELLSARKSVYFVVPVVAILYFLIKKSKKSVYLLMAAGVLLMLFNKYLVTGLFLFMNKISELVGFKTHLFLSSYEVAKAYEKLGVIIFSALILSLLIWLIDYLIEGFKSIYLIALLSSLLLIQLIYSESIWVLFPLILVMLVLLNYQLQAKGSRGKIPLIVALMLSLISLSIIGGSHLLLSAKTYERPTFAMKAERFITEKYQEMRYGKSKENGITHDFTRLNKLSLSEKEDLEVVMEIPESYYLRGFVGTDYSKTKWETLDHETRYINHGLFHSLEKQDFKPLSQLSKAREIGLKKDETLELNKLTIHNKHASSKYFLTPYELVDEDLEAHEFKEYGLISRRFFGERNYQMTASSDLVTIYPQIANRIYKNKEKDDLTKRYLDAEAFYNAYVYEHYTKLPKDVRNVLDMYVGKEGDERDEHPPYEQAIEFVDAYLEETLTYTEEPKVLPYKKDFISFLLKESEEGYAPHYATAATVIFRYLGIPARYVEGYLITPDLIKDKAPYEKISLKNKENHAWTEIYFDEIGWLPLEFTPPYKDKMRETDLTDYPKGEWSDEEKEREKEKIIEEKENTPPPPAEAEDIEESEQESQRPDEGSNKDSSENETENEAEAEVDELEDDPEIIKFSLWILLAILLLFLLIYLIYFIKKRLDLRKVTQTFLADDLNQAVFMLTSYSVMLIHASGIKERGGSLKKYEKDIRKQFGQDISRRFLELVNLNQAVVYGNKTLTEEERQVQVQFKNDLLEALIKDKSFFEKLRMRFIDFLY